ncbi:GNAT family N-acetyltransferase [bacterium]|jgi:L-amino acid N-acyltransferase YncA|nr:GNAT family N-acetyltransferase [bacterium]
MTILAKQTRNRPASQLVTTNEVTALLYSGEKFASLGRVEFLNRQNTETNRAAARELLRLATGKARAEGHKTLIAPLDGDTWHSYRTIIESSPEPKFLLEPDSLLSADILKEAGFHLIAQYSSSLIDLSASQATIDATLAKRQRAIESSFSIRHFNSNRFDDEIKDIYELSLKSFENNFLYQPISFEQFAELYRPLSALIKDELVWLAFDHSKLVGILFALPDRLNEGQIILKSVAVHPEFAGLGLASYLLARVHIEAINLGFTRSVQALYKDENRSATLTAGLSSKIIRRYGLFSLDLDFL